MNSLFELIFKFRGVGIEGHQYGGMLDGKLQQNKAVSIVEYHLKNNPSYRKYLEDIDVKILSDVPIMSKAILQQGHDLWISNPYNGKKLFRNKTSGSSGVPLVFAKDWECHARTWGYIKYRYAQHGIDVFRDLEARFYGIPMDSWISNRKEKLKDRIANRVRFPVFDLSDGVLAKYYQRFYKRKFVYLNGYTSSLVAFASFILKTGKHPLSQVCPTLKACITTSEMCSEEDRQVMEEGFGIKVVNEYGAAELDIIAFEDEDGDWVLNEDNLYVEVVDENDIQLPDGQEGRILVTSLYNKAMPFIRYELGDRGIISTRRKHGYRILEKLTGRTNDMATLPSGKVVPGLTFYYVTKSLLKEEGLIRELVIHQMAPDKFKVLYSASRELSSVEIDQVKRLLAVYIEPGLNIDIIRVDEVAREKSGKLMQFKKMYK